MATQGASSPQFFKISVFPWRHCIHETICVEHTDFHLTFVGHCKFQTDFRIYKVLKIPANEICPASIRDEKLVLFAYSSTYFAAEMLTGPTFRFILSRHFVPFRTQKNEYSGQLFTALNPTVIPKSGLSRTNIFLRKFSGTGTSGLRITDS